jgi:DNA polymerase-3 subunit alpha
MTAVLTAFRSNEEKVAAAIAECRRMGIEVLPPDVHRSGLEFTVEGQAIRFGLLAVKNVGQGAIESIVAARDTGGEFKTLRDFCERVDLRLVNSRVIEALAWVGALSAFGHPVQIIEALPTILPSAQAVQQQQATGQLSAFDLMFAEAPVEALPQRTEAPRRERLRKEKELLGLYLSEHPMGEVAEQVGAFVTAYSGDLKDESLDGQRIVVGGIVTGFRTQVTKTQSLMAFATLEDLQGSIEVVVFPRTYEQTIGSWTDGAILLVAGRVDHRGDDVQLLADLVTDWEEAVAKGPEQFARDVAAGDRGRGPRRPSSGTTPSANGNGHGPAGERPLTPVMAPEAVAASAIGGVAVAARPDEVRPGVPRVSPLRAEAQVVPTGLPPITPAEPIATYPEPAGSDEAPDEPPLPDEARARVATESAAPTHQVESQPDQTLHVRFGAAAPDRLVVAMEAFKSLLAERPGATRVVLHVPAPTGRGALPMELRRGVAYDAELLAEVRRRLGDGLVELRLS